MKIGAESNSKRETRRAAAPQAAKGGLKSGCFRADLGETGEKRTTEIRCKHFKVYSMTQNGGFDPYTK